MHHRAPDNMTSTPRPITRIRDERYAKLEDDVAVEEPLEIRVGHEPIAITMRTPGHDDDLAAGFLLTEGIVRDPDDLESVVACTEDEYGNIAVATLTDEAARERRQRIACSQRETFMSSSCGLCGKQTLDRIEQQVDAIGGKFRIDQSTLLQLSDRMRKAQATFDRTGGLHAAAIFNPAGDLCVLREDIGRHNAVDKVIGHMLLMRRLPMEDAVLMVSGRSSFEIMQKAAMARIAMVVAVSAPSSLAVDFATRLNMTLIGFLRRQQMNIYAGEHRVRLQDEG